MNKFSLIIPSYQKMSFQLTMLQLIHICRNKYVIVSTFFLIWMLFFDRNDLLTQYQYWIQMKKLEQEKEFYTKEIAKTHKDLDELNTNPNMLEKFAREKYLMKKPNEDIFVIIKETSNK